MAGAGRVRSMKAARRSLGGHTRAAAAAAAAADEQLSSLLVVLNEFDFWATSDESSFAKTLQV